MIPVTVDDLAANDLLGEAHPQVCWERSVETLTARKEDIAGLAVASDERIEAYILYIEGGEIVALRSFIEDGGARLKQLLSRLGSRDLPVPEGPPGRNVEGVPGHARIPPRGPSSSLRRDSAGRINRDRLLRHHAGRADCCCTPNAGPGDSSGADANSFRNRRDSCAAQ